MKSPSKTKRLVYAALAGIGITAGAAGLASAATNQTPATSPRPTQTAPADSNANDTGDAPSYKSSVTVPQTPDSAAKGDNEAGKGDNETADAAKLAPLAKITPQQASAAATAKVPGSAGPAQLEEENGNVLYAVEVKAANGTTTDVKVDAGNAHILAQQSDAEKGSETPGSTTGD